MSPDEMLARVEARFRLQHDKGAFPGGQLVVRAHGDELLNVSLGLASGFRLGEGEAVAVTDRTMFQVMSASKPVIAFLIAVLEDRGLVDVARPVAHYIPEFGREGKGDITVLDVLTHRSGVHVPHLWNAPDTWASWERIQEEIWNAQPRYRRGTLAYHPYEFGWILGEIVRRVTGRSLDEFLDEVMPGQLKSLRFRLDRDAASTVARNYWLGGKRYRLGKTDMAARFEETYSSESILAGLAPGASMATTASVFAQFYEMLLQGGTTADGTRLIGSDTLERYISRNYSGFDRMLRSRLILGRGFLLGWLWPHPYGWWDSRGCFGHGGGFCAMTFGDRRTGAAVAILTNGNRNLVDVMLRFAPLGSLIRKSFRHS